MRREKLITQVSAWQSTRKLYSLCRGSVLIDLRKPLTDTSIALVQPPHRRFKLAKDPSLRFRRKTIRVSCSFKKSIRLLRVARNLSLCRSFQMRSDQRTILSDELQLRTNLLSETRILRIVKGLPAELRKAKPSKQIRRYHCWNEPETHSNKGMLFGELRLEHIFDKVTSIRDTAHSSISKTLAFLTLNHTDKPRLKCISQVKRVLKRSCLATNDT